MKITKTKIVLSAIVAMNVILSTTFYMIQKNIDKETEKQQIKIATVQKKIDHLPEVSKGDLLAKASKGTEVEKENTKQYQDESIATKYAEKLFNVLFTFGNSEEYEARSKRIGYMLDQQVLNDKKLFGSDKDSTGNSAIDALQLRSTFDSITSYCTVSDNKQISLISKVSFSASKGEYEPGKETTIYLSKFDVEKHQFTEVRQLGTLD